MNNYIANLSLRGKFLLIAIAMLVPISVLSFMTARLEWQSLSMRASTENIGLDWASELLMIAANLSEYREHSIAVAGGAENERGEMRNTRASSRNAAAKLDELMADGNEELHRSVGLEGPGAARQGSHRR